LQDYIRGILEGNWRPITAKQFPIILNP